MFVWYYNYYIMLRSNPGLVIISTTLTNQLTFMTHKKIKGNYVQNVFCIHLLCFFYFASKLKFCVSCMLHYSL